jgi:hypothetical protein
MSKQNIADDMSLELRLSSRKSSANAPSGGGGGGGGSGGVGEWSCPSPDFRLTNASPQRMSSVSDATRSLYERANTGMEELLRYLKVMRVMMIVVVVVVVVMMMMMIMMMMMMRRRRRRK